MTHIHPLFVLFLFTGSQLQICPSGLTCCTEEMESQLRASSEETYRKAMQSAANPIQRLFSSKANKFDGERLSHSHSLSCSLSGTLMRREGVKRGEEKKRIAEWSVRLRCHTFD